MEPTDITKYIDMAKRRKYWIIITFLLAVLGGLGYFLMSPKIYRAETLILVQQQKVPEEFVRSIVTTSVEDRLRTISQQVTSRTNLEKIVKEYHLYTGPVEALVLDAVIMDLRKRIKIEVGEDNTRTETSTFTIAFRGEDPKKVMQVTNALASNFITENLRIRESQALGTSAFLADELEAVKKRLMEKEADLKKYREKNMGGLPEQLRANLSILERLQSQLEQYADILRDAENRKIVIQKEISDSKKAYSTFSTLATSAERQNVDVGDIVTLRNQLASLEVKYTENHPDVIRLKALIQKIEIEKGIQSPDGNSGNETERMSRVDQALLRELQDVELKIANLKAEIEETKSKIKWYEQKVQETPKREQELITLNRDYQNQQKLYSSLLNRKLEAEISLSMEKKQKGEQFHVIDPARRPSSPVEPDIRRIFLMTVVLGLGLGCALAYIMEMMDTSYKIPEEVEQELNFPVLMSIPIRYTKKELRKKFRVAFLKAASVTVCFVLSAAFIVVSIKGLDTTVNYVKNLLEKI